MTTPVRLPAEVTTSLPPAQVQKITKAAQAFEAMALGQLLAPMFETVKPGPFSGGDGEQAWRPMLVQELAKHMAEHGGIGLARPVMLQMLRMQEQSTEKDPA